MVIEIDGDIAFWGEPFHPLIPEIRRQECQNAHDRNPWENPDADIGCDSDMQQDYSHDPDHTCPAIEYRQNQEYWCYDLDEHASLGNPIHRAEMRVEPVSHAGPEGFEREYLVYGTVCAVPLRSELQVGCYPVEEYLLCDEGDCCGSHDPFHMGMQTHPVPVAFP